MKGGLNVILSFADDAKGKTGNAYYSALFAGWERGEHPILDKGEGRKLSNLTKWFGEKAGEGEEKLEHSSSAKRLTRGLGKTAEHVYLGKGLGVGKVGGKQTSVSPLLLFASLLVPLLVFPVLCPEKRTEWVG